MIDLTRTSTCLRYYYLGNADVYRPAALSAGGVYMLDQQLDGLKYFHGGCDVLCQSLVQEVLLIVQQSTYSYTCSRSFQLYFLSLIRQRLSCWPDVHWIKIIIIIYIIIIFDIIIIILYYLFYDKKIIIYYILHMIIIYYNIIIIIIFITFYYLFLLFLPLL